jgi:hypothetical protein
MFDIGSIFAQLFEFLSTSFLGQIVEFITGFFSGGTPA